MKQIKRINRTFLGAIVLGLVEMCLVALLSMNNVELDVITSLILSQATIAIPGLVFLIIGKEAVQNQIPFKKIKFTSVCMLIVFTQLCLPLISAVNVFTQLFTTNAAAELSSEVIDTPFFISVLIIGFLGPLCEELFFRGIIFNGLNRASGRLILSCVISALFFGIMHMNANQCAYAFLLGIIFAFIDASLESIWPSVICHVTINTQNIALVYFVEKIVKDVTSQSVVEQAASIDKTMLLITALTLLAFALFTTVLAALLFVGICNNEGQFDKVASYFKRTDEDSEISKKPLLTVSGYIAIVVCVYLMFLIKPTMTLIKLFTK